MKKSYSEAIEKDIGVQEEDEFTNLITTN